MTLFGHYLSVLEIIGVFLAVIGFFNLSGPLERWFRWVRIYARATRVSSIRKLKKHWPPIRHWKHWLWETYCLASSMLVTIFLARWLSADAHNWLDWLGALPAWIQALIILGLFPLVMFGMFLWDMLWTGFVFLAGTVLWRMFRVMAKAPAGVVGTIGLIVTLGSLALG